MILFCFKFSQIHTYFLRYVVTHFLAFPITTNTPHFNQNELLESFSYFLLTSFLFNITTTKKVGEGKEQY